MVCLLLSIIELIFLFFYILSNEIIKKFIGKCIIIKAKWLFYESKADVIFYHGDCQIFLKMETIVL